MIDALYRWRAGIGFKDPLHAPFTHFPIGLSVGALLFFLGALLFRRKSLVLTARHAAILAFLFAFPTILFGVFDWLHFFEGVLLREIKIKMILAAVAVIGLGYFGARLVYGGWAPSAAAARLPLKSSRHLSSERAFIRFIREPKRPDGSPGSMPAFPAERISDRQAEELYQYILAMRSRWP